MKSLGAVILLSRADGSPSLFLNDILFDPAARWLAKALERAGVERFLVLGHADDLAAAQPCFPEAATFSGDGSALPGFLRELTQVLVITRPLFVSDSAAAELTAADPAPLMDALAQDSDWEQVLHQFQTPIEQALLLTGRTEDWDTANTLARRASVARLQAGGVRFIDKEQVYIGPEVTVERGTLLLPGTILKGKTSIGAGCVIGPNAMINDCAIGARVTVNASQLNQSTIDDDTTVGPFAYVRPNCHVGKHVKVGDFVELKNSTIGDGTKISHLTYVGDTDAGAHINFGCGTVTVNYDGKKKFRTTIKDGAFIGCNTNLVAPVTVGEGAYTAAGSTITRDVPADALSVARARQTDLNGWAKRRREQ